MAMFTAAIMAVNPMMTVVRPMARHPNHLVIAFPITRAMAVKWLVANFDVEALRLNRGPKSKTRSSNRCEQDCSYNTHVSDSDAKVKSRVNGK